MRILKERITSVAPKDATMAASTAETKSQNNKRTILVDAVQSAKKKTLPGEESGSDDDDVNLVPNFQRVPSIQPLNGFVPEMTYFLGGGDRLITVGSGERFLCYINARECADECTAYDFRAPVSAILVAHNFQFLVVCIDHRRQGAIIVVKDTSTFDTIISFPVRVLAQQMCISLNNKVLLLFSAQPHGLSAAMCTYATLEGTLISEAKIVSSIPTSHWEISFCPADEDVICLLADDHVNLMRSASTLISVFSTHKIADVTCHTWADDVTQAFGTRYGRIILYRETVPLEVIDLKELHARLISEVYDSPTASVVKMYSCEYGMLVCVEAGVIFFFPPSGSSKRDGSAVPTMPLSTMTGASEISRWKNSKAIVLNSLMQTRRCLRLHLDESGGNILYADASSIYTCNVSYSETVCKEGMRPIVQRHSAPIIHVSVDVNTNFVASADTSNLVLVTSANTGKVLAGSTIRSLVGVSVLPGGYKILIATRAELAVYAVLYQSLQKVARIEGCGTGFQAIAADLSNKRVAVIWDSQLLIFRTDSLEKAVESYCGTKQDVLRVRWSLDSSLIGILSTCDTICLIETETGTLLWIAEFKLRFFVDLSVVDANRVYVMSNKFMMSRLDGGRKTETFTVHHEAVNFKELSTVLLSTQRLNFVGTSTGAMIRVENENFERNVLVNCRQMSSITTLTHNRATNQLYVGYEDGQVICFNIVDGSVDNSDNMAVSTLTDGGLNVGDTQRIQDFVLCPVEEIVRCKTIIRELHVERNMIREQGQQILSEYRKRKETEILQLNAQLERLSLEMSERMKKADEKLEAIEMAKEEVVAKMNTLTQDEIRTQKLQYEKMLNDQIKMFLEKEKHQREANDEVIQGYDNRIADMERATVELEARWSKQAHILQERLNELGARLRQKAIQLEKAHTEQRMTDATHAAELKVMCAQQEQERRDQIEAVKQLKAKVLRLHEETQKLRDSLEEVREKFHTTNDELEDCQVQLESKTQAITEEVNKNHELDRKLDLKKNELSLMTQKYKILQSEVDQERVATAQRRLREFDTLVSEMAGHVYDARRLEQSVLGLLAFFNATKVPALNRATVMPELRQNQVPAVPETAVPPRARRSGSAALRKAVASRSREKSQPSREEK